MWASTPTVRDAFSEFLQKGKPAYVPHYRLEVGEIIELIHQAGGMAVLAHPKLIHDDTIAEAICIGQAASMGSVLLTAGAKGKRFALPMSRIMIHQPLGGAQGQSTDIQIQAKEILRIREVINEILVKTTGQKLEKVIEDTERDNFMTAAEAKAYGLIDEVITRKEKAAKSSKTKAES